MSSNKISPQSSVKFVRWRTSALKAKAYVLSRTQKNKNQKFHAMMMMMCHCHHNPP
jgi:hypothetical protein